MPIDVINEHLSNRVCDVGFITGVASLNCRIVSLFSVRGVESSWRFR
jgi:hypothetical protein